MKRRNGIRLRATQFLGHIEAEKPLIRHFRGQLMRELAFQVYAVSVCHDLRDKSLCRVYQVTGQDSGHKAFAS